MLNSPLIVKLFDNPDVWSLSPSEHLAYFKICRILDNQIDGIWRKPLKRLCFQAQVNPSDINAIVELGLLKGSDEPTDTVTMQYEQRYNDGQRRARVPFEIKGPAWYIFEIARFHDSRKYRQAAGSKSLDKKDSPRLAKTKRKKKDLSLTKDAFNDPINQFLRKAHIIPKQHKRSKKAS